MRHKYQQTDPDVALTLVSGISGIPPRDIKGYALFTVNTECGTHLTTSACCVYHAVEQVLDAWASEVSALTPCSGDGG